MPLGNSDQTSISERAARLEARTGVQIVAAVVDKCDAYPEIPWKAFALASALAALASVFWRQNAVLAILTFLGVGAAAALASVFLPAFARLFVDAARRETETRQYAASFFLAHDLSRTQRRSAILILVGVFERTVVLLPDRGLHLAESELQEVIARMTPALAAGRVAAALRDGLDALEVLLIAKGGTASEGCDEIAQEIFEEKGA